MATEADIPESIISITKREGEIIYSTRGQFDTTVNETSPGELKKFQEVLNVPPETVEYLGETKNVQAVNGVGAEAMNTLIKVNVETPEGEKFLGSPSAVLVGIEDTCRGSKSSEPEEVTLQVGAERVESNKQVEVAGETGTEEKNVTEDSEEKPEQNNMSCDIVNLTNSMEEIGDTSSKEVQKKEAEESINSLDEVPEVIKPSERAAEADEDEEEKSAHKAAEETFTSATDMSSVQEAGNEVGAKLQESSSISYDEKSQDKIEPSKKMECTTSDEDEINHKNNVDTSAMQTEETHLQKIDSTEPLKVASKIWPDGIIKESPGEVKEQIEMSEKTVGNKSASNETGRENENHEQKGDGSFVIQEGTLSVNEVLPAKEASSGENRYEEESFVAVTKDNIADTEIIDAFEHQQSGISNSEERPENLQQNEQEEEKLEGSLNVVAEDSETTTSVKEETPTKTQEKSSDKEIKRDLPDQTDANVPPIELNEKTKCVEVEVPDKNVNDLHVTPALIEEAEQTEGKNLDKVFNSEPEGKIPEAYEECMEKEKHIEDAPEACPGESSTILEQRSTEGAETTELIPKARETDIQILQEASGPDFEEKSVIIDNREKTDQEMQKNGEACDTVTKEILANSADAGKYVIDAETTGMVSNAVARCEKVEQNIQVSPLETAPDLTGQDESCIADGIDKRNDIANEEEHDGTKIAATVVAITEQVLEDHVTQILPESIDKQNDEICEANRNVVEESEGENNREHVTEDSNINCLVPESVEQVAVNDLKYENTEAEESTEEIFQNSDTAETAESITYKAVKKIESPKEILDGSTAQQGEGLQGEERNLTPTETSPEEKRNEGTSPVIVVSEPLDAKDNIEKKTAESEEDLKHVSLRNEPEEDLPPSLSTTSDKNEAFNSDADKTTGDVEEGPTQNLEEALQKEENEKRTVTEEKNDTESSKTATEEDLEKIDETSDASKSKESTVFEPRSEMDILMVEDEIKKEESEELYQDSSDGCKDEETEKHNMKEECGATNILPEPIGEEPLQSSKQEKDDMSIELEEEEIEQSSQGNEYKQGSDTYISPVAIEQKENSEGNKNEAENTQGENNREQSVEESNSRGLIPESVEQIPVKNLEDYKLKEDKSAAEISGNSETSRVAESAAHETSTTIESTAEILDTSLVKQECFQNEEENITATESSTEEKTDEDRCLVQVAEENGDDNELRSDKDNIEKKPSTGEEDLQHTLQENEPEEKHERSISVMSNENEVFRSNADKTPCLTEEGTSQDLEEAPQKEDTVKETEEKNVTEDNKKATEENLGIVAESSDASESMESILLEPKSENDTMLAQDEIKKEESEELYEDSKIADKSESEKENALEECGTTNILPEPTEEKTHQSFEEGKGGEIVKSEACRELETTRTSAREDAERKIIEEHIVEQSTELEVEKVKKSSKEDDMAAKTSKQEECEITQIDNEDDTRRGSIEKGDADENKFDLFARGTDNEDTLIKENEEKEQDKQAFEAEASSTSIEKQDIVQAEQLIGQVKEEIVEENSKEDGSIALKLKDQVDDSNSLIKETEATISAEETLSETLKGRAESNMNSYSLDVTKVSQAEILTEETNGSLIEESANVSHMSNKETEEEIEEKEETKINDSDSACIGVVREGKGLQEAQPEDKKQVEGVGSAFEESGISEIETNETVPESVNISAKPKDTPDLGEKRDSEIPTLSDAAGETNEGLIEESAMVSHTPNKETEEAITENEKITIEDSDSESITSVSNATGLQEAEPEDKERVESVGPAFEEKGVPEIETKETTPESVDISVKPEDTSDRGEQRNTEVPTVAEKAKEMNEGLIEESATVLHTPNRETEEEITEKEETTIKDSDSAPITVVTEAKGLLEAKSEDKEQEESVGPAFEEKGTAEIETKETTQESVDISVKTEDTFDSGEQRNTEIPTVADKTGETNEGLIEESAMGSHTPNRETEEEITDKEETTIRDSDSVPITVVTEAKGLLEAEPEDKEQVERVGPAFEEEGIEETETIETTLKSVDVSLKPEDTSDSGEQRGTEIPIVADKAGETNQGPIEELAMVSHTPNKETEEEIIEKEDTTIKDSDSAPITVVAEAKGLLEAQPEDKKQVESVGPAFEDKGIAETETKETTLESVDNTVKPEVTSDLGEKKDNENPTVADTGRETNGGVTEEPATVSHMSNEETEEEIKEKEETTIDSDSATVTVVTEEKGLQEAEAEDKKQLESVGPAFEEKGMAKIETAFEIVDNNVKPEDTSDLGEKRDTEIPTVADAAREKNEGLIEESALLSHTSNKETEEEIQEKDETSTEDLNSASFTVVTEAKGPQQAEPEEKKQVDSVAPAFEEKDTAEIETKETELENVVIAVKSEDKSGLGELGEKKDNEIPTVADKVGEKNEGLVEESAIVSHTPNKETEGEIKEEGETAIEDSDSASIAVVTEAKGLQEAEPEEKMQVESVAPAFEEKGMAEIETKEITVESVDINVNVNISDLGEKRDVENPTGADKARETNGGLTEESAMVSHASNEETEQEMEEQEESTIDDSDSASITVVTEGKSSLEAESEDKKQVETVVPASEEKSLPGFETKETTLESVDINVKPEDTTDLDVKRESENPTVADNEIPAVRDTVGETNEGLMEESAMLSHTSDGENGEEIEKEEENTIDDSDAVSIAVVTEAKGSQEADAEDKKQVVSVGSSFKEKGIAEIEAAPESVDNNVKPEDTSDLGEKRDTEIPSVADAAKETNEGLIEESATVLHTSSKETEEEIKEKDETSIEDSNSASTTLVTEAKGSQEVEPENKKLAESVDPAFEEKGIAETETKEITPESVDINMKTECTSDLVEKRDREIPKVVDEARETIDSEIQNDVPYAPSEHHTEVTTTDKPLEEISKDILVEYCTVTSKEPELTTTEVTETVYETPAQDQTPFENTETTCVARAIDERLTNEQDETINPVNVSEPESADSEKETADEKVQKQKVEPENTENFSKSEDVEISKGEETGRLADERGVCKSTTLKDVESLNVGLQMEKIDDEKQLDGTLKTSETSGVCTESEKTILEQEISKGNLKEVELGNAADEPEAEDVNHKDHGIVPEDKLGCTSEAVAEIQTSETLPVWDKSQIEESSSDNQNREDDNEIEEKKESQLELEEHEEQNANETTKAVILTEKGQEGVEQSDDSGDIKKLVVQEARGISEVQASTVDETTDEMENSAPVISECNKAVDLKEQMKAENSEIEDIDNAEREIAARENSGADESVATIIVPNVVDVTKDLGAEETAEAAKGPTVENIDQIPTSDCAHIQKEKVAVENPKADEVNEIKLVSNATYESKDQETEEPTGETSTVENREAGEEREETKIAYDAVFESKGLAAEEAEVKKSQTVETSDQFPTNIDDNAGRKNAAMEISGADEVKEIKVVSDTIYVFKGREAEEAEVGKKQRVEDANQVPTNDDDHAERETAAAENSDADEVEETKKISNAVEATKDQSAGETAETGKSHTVEKMDQITTSNFEHAQKGSVALENPRADEVNEIKLGSDATYESNDQDTEESAKEIPTVEKVEQVPAANSEQTEEDRVTVQYPDAEEHKETKKDQITEDVDETGKNTTEAEEACKAASDYRAQGIQPVTENDIIADQTPSEDKLNERLPTPIPTLPSEDETTATFEKIEEEKPRVGRLEDEVPEDTSAVKPTKEFCLQSGSREIEDFTAGININKDMKDSSTEVYEEEGQSPEEILNLEPLENENKMKCADSSSESKSNTDLTGPTEKGNLESETIEKAFQSEAEIHCHEILSESEDTEIKDKHVGVISDVRTDEGQCQKTSVSKEEITEEKEVAKTCQPISLCEEKMSKSLQEDELKAEECREAETNNACKATVSGIHHGELPLDAEKVAASTNIREQVAPEDRSAEYTDLVLVENKIVKESFPQECKGRDVVDSAIKLDPEKQGDESNFGSGGAEVTTPRDEDSSMDASQKESIKQFAKEGELIQETQESKESSCATTEKQIPTEAELIERSDTIVQTGNEYDPPVQQEGITETQQKAEVEDLKPGNAKGVNSEAEVNQGAEQKTDCSGVVTTEGSVLVDSTEASLSDLLQRSRKETIQVAELASKATEPAARTEENQTAKPETIQVKDAKMNEEKEEEEGGEHNKTDSSASDAPVVVEVSKDMYVKAAHKKSHNILSGVGSKMKHSISKVKKAITGKSSHTKPVSPK